jgi:hypothetical protein
MFLRPDSAVFGIYPPWSIFSGSSSGLHGVQFTRKNRNDRVGIAGRHARAVVWFYPNVSRDGRTSHLNEFAAARCLDPARRH